MKSIFIFLLLPVMVYCQLNPNTLLPNVMPSNPEAFQFMKYGEIPVQNYTGIPDISIPIYTFETKALNIPIILKYHANGIKVNEEASWVGLGWDLSTDMEIVQTVSGLDDFGYYKWRSLANYSCMIPIEAGLQASSVMSTCGTFFLGADDDWNINHPDCMLDTHFMANLWDTEPDIFYFNMAGYSGKFVLNWNTEQFVCLTDKNIKIESDYSASNNSDNSPSTFSITVPDGHRFQFALKESTTIDFSSTVDNSTGPLFSYVDPRGQKSSRVYKLVKIMTAQADVIDFQYESAQNNAGMASSSKNFPYITEVNRDEVAFGTNNFVVQNEPNALSAVAIETPNTVIPQYFITSYTGTSQTYSYLKSINYNGEHIEFITSSRIDLKEAKKLDEIKVTFKGGAKRFLFNYDYFTGNDEGNNWDSMLNYHVDEYISGKTNDEIKKRLKLVSFNEINEKPYVFSYNPQSLPKKTSYALDFWGFYNGFHSNMTFFPNIYRFNVERFNRHYYKFQNNNNSPVLNYCKASILEQITYPTGGFTVFDYELNAFDNYKVPPPEQGAPVSINLTTIPGNNSISSKVVSIEGGNTIFNVYGLLSTQGCYPQYPEAYSSCNFKISHFKKELMDYIRNNTVLNSHLNSYGLTYVLGADLHFLDGIPNNPALYNQYNDINVYIGKTVNLFDDEWVNNRQINLPEGIAIFKVSGGCGPYGPTANNNWSQATFTVNYGDNKPLPEGDSYGAGLRIKSVTSFPALATGPSASAFKKVYEYEGGKLMSPLLFFNKMPSSYRSYKIAYVPNAYLNATLALTSFELIKAMEKFIKNPNLKSAVEASQKLEQQKISVENPPYGDNDPIWVLLKDFFGDRNELHSQSYVTPSTSASGRYVGYDKVTEKYENYNAAASDLLPGIGKEVIYYSNNPDIGAPSTGIGTGYYTQINLPLTVQYPENGNLTKKETFTEQGELKKQVLNGYQFIQEPCLWGMKTLTTDITDVAVGHDLGDYIKKAKYFIGSYPIKSGKTVLTHTEMNTFENGNEISVYKHFTYDSHNQVKTITETNSRNEIVETSLSYPYDLSSSSYNTYNGMVGRNILTPVVQALKKVNSLPVSLEQTYYQWISTPDPDSYFQSTYAIDRIGYSKSGFPSDLKDVAQFHNYDGFANPTEVSQEDGTRVSYIWGYNGKYPVAKIINASQPSFNNATQGLTIINASLQQAVIDASNSGNETNLLTALDNLRNSLPNAMVTTFTYKPLVGVSTITDAKGSRVTYVYNSSNRLQFVKDSAGNILSENQYHFRP
ncbi:MAG: hypothetical protein H7339_17095 [Arcicella sp.]|nr:hypothetical protein [Arcicella sp.]